MVLDAPGPNGPFQPVALMHFRGEMFGTVRRVAMQWFVSAVVKTEVC